MWLPSHFDPQSLVAVIDIEKLIIMILGLQLPSHKLTPP